MVEQDMSDLASLLLGLLHRNLPPRKYTPTESRRLRSMLKDRLRSVYISKSNLLEQLPLCKTLIGALIVSNLLYKAPSAEPAGFKMQYANLASIVQDTQSKALAGLKEPRHSCE